MDWFSFIFHLSVVYFVFGFLWQWIVFLPLSFVLETVGIKPLYSSAVSNLAGNYFLATFTAFYSIATGSIFIFIVGAIFLVLQNFVNLGQKMKDAQDTQDYEAENSLTYGSIAVFFGLGMYILIYFVPGIGINPFTEWFSDTIDWVATLPIIKWMIWLIAFVNVINIILFGLIAMFGLLRAVLKPFSSAKQE